MRSGQRELVTSPGHDYWIGRFTAMASPCELLLELEDRTLAQQLLDIAADEARRIEEKYSRYRDDNIVYRINNAGGATVKVDEETSRLLDYADQLYLLSNGLFDITAGILRRVWQFTPTATLPEQTDITACLAHIGWDKVKWHPPFLTLPADMEIDLGGIGKEYAVDRVANLLKAQTDCSFVVNFGGDLYISKTRANGEPWQIALDDPAATGIKRLGTLNIHQGALATSGDARRHLLHQGRRYSHILNPQTGWPVTDAPHSITVHAPTCMEAGMIATIAMLHGDSAEKFLRVQEIPYWLIDG